MLVQIHLDKDEPLNPDELLGEVKILSAREFIKEESTYVDSWLEALAKGAEQVRYEQVVTVDLVEEPDPLVFERREGRIRISHQNSSVHVQSEREILDAVQEATLSVLKSLEDEGWGENDRKLQRLKALVEGRINRSQR